MSNELSENELAELETITSQVPPVYMNYQRGVGISSYIEQFKQFYEPRKGN